MKGLRLLLVIIFASLGVVLPLWLMRHGINFQDEPYQMLNAAEYLFTPMAALSAWTGHLWAGVFGFNLLAFRWFAVACVWLSVGIPVIYFYRRTRRFDLSLALFGLASSWLAMIPSKSYLYGWDNLSTLLIVALMTLSMSYIHRPGIAKAAGCGALAGLAMLSRMPNIICLAIVLPVIISVAPSGKKTVFSLATFGAFVAIAVLFISLIYGSPGNYFAILRENVISGHGLDYLLEGYGRTGLPLVRFTALAAAIILVLRAFPGLLSAIIVLAVVILGCNLPGYPLATTANFMSVGLLVGALIIVPGRVSARLLIAAMALCGTAGSDMGWEKVISVQTVILLAAVCKAQARKPLLISAAVMWSVVMWIEMPAQRERGFEDKGFANTYTLVKSGPFAGINTTGARAKEIARLDRAIKEWRDHGGSVLVIGDCFHYGVDLISGSGRPASIRHDYLIDYTNYPSKIETLIADSLRSGHPLMVISSRPMDWRYKEILAPYRIPALAGWPTEDTPNFTIYTYTPDR